MLNQQRGKYETIFTVCVVCMHVRVCVCMNLCVVVRVCVCVCVRLSDCLCLMHCFIPHPVTWRK